VSSVRESVSDGSQKLGITTQCTTSLKFIGIAFAVVVVVSWDAFDSPFDWLDRKTREEAAAASARQSVTARHFFTRAMPTKVNHTVIKNLSEPYTIQRVAMLKDVL
jgi:hypothetical protein